MRLLKLVFAITALAIAFGAPLAKAQGTEAPKRQSAAEKAKADYNLTDEQFKKVDAIYKDIAKQKRAVSKEDPEKKAKDAAITKAGTAKIRAVLDDEQKAKFDAATKKGGSKKHKGDAQKKKVE